MSQNSSESQPPIAVPATRQILAPSTVVFLAVWACVFAAFTILGLRS